MQIDCFCNTTFSAKKIPENYQKLLMQGRREYEEVYSNKKNKKNTYELHVSCHRYGYTSRTCRLARQLQLAINTD